MIDENKITYRCPDCGKRSNNRFDLYGCCKDKKSRELESLAKAEMDYLNKK